MGFAIECKDDLQLEVVVRQYVNGRPGRTRPGSLPAKTVTKLEKAIKKIVESDDE